VDGDAKDAFGEENSFGVMSEGAVAKVGEKRLRFVNYVDNALRYGGRVR